MPQSPALSRARAPVGVGPGHRVRGAPGRATSRPWATTCAGSGSARPGGADERNTADNRGQAAARIHQRDQAARRCGRKTYLGPDPQRRFRVEHAALSGLHGRFPVPAVLPSPDGELRVEEVVGRHGQDALDGGDPAQVLRLCGLTRRRLSEIDPATVPGLPGNGDVIVHGDFGPQNMLLNADINEVLAVVDWELCHLGAAVEDLAWTEWIVRTHHPLSVRHLGELFAGFGSRPPWPERKAAMLDLCSRCHEFCRRWGDPAAARMWDERITVTEAFRE